MKMFFFKRFASNFIPRTDSIITEAAPTVITIPKYLEPKMARIKHKRLAEVEHTRSRRLAGFAEVTSKYKSEKNGCLSSAGWALNKNAGDRITISNWMSDSMTHIFMRTDKKARDVELLKLLQPSNVKSKSKSTIIFSNYEITCDWLGHFLEEQGFQFMKFNEHVGRFEKQECYAEQRRNGDKGKIMICTNWGRLDLSSTERIINFEMPTSPRDYVARCRAAKRSLQRVYSFVCFKPEVLALQTLERIARSDTKDPMEALLSMRREQMTTMTDETDNLS